MTITTTVLIAAALWFTPTADAVLTGRATHYAPGRMRQVADYRGLNLSTALGPVVLNRRGDLGRYVWIDLGHGPQGPYRSVDCAQQGPHFIDRERQHLILEVDADTAARHGFTNRSAPVTVLFDPPHPPGAPAHD